jgi:hypothetical protein
MNEGIGPSGHRAIAPSVHRAIEDLFVVEPVLDPVWNSENDV